MDLKLQTVKKTLHFLSQENFCLAGAQQETPQIVVLILNELQMYLHLMDKESYWKVKGIRADTHSFLLAGWRRKKGENVEGGKQGDRR